MTRLENNLKISNKKVDPLTLVWTAGKHKLIILNDDIVKRLDIKENLVLEQVVTDEGILLKIKNF